MAGFVLGATGSFLLMANQHQLRHGALWGLLSLLGAVAGLLWALGLLRRPEADTPSLLDRWLGSGDGEPAWRSPRRTAPAAALLVLAGFVLGPQALPYALLAALLVLALSVVGRPALLTFLICSGLLLPLLGTYGLWDPWETHYGEVAREILSRDDWISLWWAQDKWFWSKPILIFWSEALTWSASGVDFRPDTNPEGTEWILRFPIWLLATIALMSVYTVVSRIFSVRAGMLSAMVLATTPYFGFLCHQAITDMPFVASMTTAIMLLLMAFATDPQAQVREYRLGRFSISAQGLVIGLFVLLTLPQALYLASRNITFMDGLFAWHGDEFLYGSAHNTDVPGNPAVRSQRPWTTRLYLQPLAQGLLWLVAGATVVLSLRKERRVQPLLMTAFYMACAVGFMAKGLPGFALPGLVALLYLAVFGRWSIMLEGRLRIGAGVLTLFCVSLPWFVAMFIRHGPAFTDRLLVHDHINRLTTGVHGDKGQVQYFVEQLGFGIFPWIALAPVALGSWLWLRPQDGETPVQRSRRETVQLVGLWFAATFTLFSAMTTKFHHYIFPAVPAAAVLTGLLLDRMWGEPGGSRGLGGRLATAAAFLFPLPLVLAAAGLRGDVRGVLPAGLAMGQRAVWVFQNRWDGALCAGLLLVAVLLVALAIRHGLSHWRERHGAAGVDGLGAGLLGGALLAAFVGRDMAWNTLERPDGGEHLVQLFVYNYSRPFPEQFDYRPVLFGFATALAIVMALSSLRALRPVAARGLLGLSLIFSLWLLDVYMIDLSPHWGQRELVKRYYRERKDASERLVAWQMNWKGENFYTGNRAHVFVELNNKKVKKWADAHDGERAFFVLEHKRLKRLKGMLGKDRKVNVLTSERDNNKFVLVRVAL